jgi:hypothetical protein
MPMTHRLRPTWLICFLAFGGPILPGWQQDPVSVEFFVTDGWGNTISTKATISILNATGTAPVSATDYPEHPQIRLVPGEYTIAVSARGFLPRTDHLTVANSDIFVPIPLLVAPIEGGRPLLSRVVGRLAERYRSGPPIWIRVVGVFNGVQRTARVAASGSFTVDGLPPGRYLLLVLSRGTLRETREIDVRPYRTEVEIE